MTERFSYQSLVDEMRCRPTEWLTERRSNLVREQCRLRVEELAVVAVLDERGAVDDSLAAAEGMSTRSLHEMVDTARTLEQLPEVAAAAYEGHVSSEQLAPLTRLADPESDAEWARRGPNTPPADLARLARTKTKPTAADAQARRAARSLRMWWQRDTGMLSIHGQLPDLDGSLFENTINRLVDGMRPVPGASWASRDQRAADALSILCRDYSNDEAPRAAQALLVVEVPIAGPAEVAGIPLPDSVVESLLASGRIEPVLVDGDGARIAAGRVASALSHKIARAVGLRDGHCRWPGCTRRTGLQVHHLWPRSWGGTDEISNLAMVCVGGGTDHHVKLVPHGELLLLGNPNRPDGLQLLRRDELAELAQLASDATRSRGDPSAA